MRRVSLTRRQLTGRNFSALVRWCVRCRQACLVSQTQAPLQWLPQRTCPRSTVRAAQSQKPTTACAVAAALPSRQRQSVSPDQAATPHSRNSTVHPLQPLLHRRVFICLHRPVVHRRPPAAAAGRRRCVLPQHQQRRAEQQQLRNGWQADEGRIHSLLAEGLQKRGLFLQANLRASTQAVTTTNAASAPCRVSGPTDATHPSHPSRLPHSTHRCSSHSASIHCEAPEPVQRPQRLPLLQADGGPEVGRKPDAILWWWLRAVRQKAWRAQSTRGAPVNMLMHSMAAED